MDFAYLEKVAKLNVAALAAIASAPPPPEPKVEGAVSTDTTITWGPAPAAANYIVRWRRTDANNWQEAREEPAVVVTGCEAYSRNCAKMLGPQAGKAILPHIRVDDWVFGVSSVSKDGWESPVASAVPGGAFKPYLAPPPKPKP